MDPQKLNITVYQPPVPVPGFIHALEALQAELVADHCNGKHTYGNMRRECPLCQKGN
jgi:DNA-binding helix-hairpin-helix protein with protein kinase domain